MTEIRSVAVLGAGVMGASIAAHVANAGVPITGPKGDTRPGPVCAWFAQKAGHDVYG